MRNEPSTQEPTATDNFRKHPATSPIDALNGPPHHTYRSAARSSLDAQGLALDRGDDEPQREY